MGLHPIQKYLLNTSPFHHSLISWESKVPFDVVFCSIYERVSEFMLKCIVNFKIVRNFINILEKKMNTYS